MVSAWFNDLSYIERFKWLKLPTLAYRRSRGDMIEVYKIIHNIYDHESVPNLLKKQLYITKNRKQGTFCKTVHTKSQTKLKNKCISNSNYRTME